MHLVPRISSRKSSLLGAFLDVANQFISGWHGVIDEWDLDKILSPFVEKRESLGLQQLHLPSKGNQIGIQPTKTSR